MKKVSLEEFEQKEESIHKHTPGPWTIYNHAGTDSGHYDGYLKSDIRAGADLIHIRQSKAGNTFPRLAANVRLMAAAPSMHDALWAIANMQVQEGTDKGEVLALCKSIALLELEKCSPVFPCLPSRREGIHGGIVIPEEKRK